MWIFVQSQVKHGNAENIYSELLTIGNPHRIWVFYTKNAKEKFDTFIPNVISFIWGVLLDLAALNLTTHIREVSMSWGMHIPKPYNIQWVYQSRLGIFMERAEYL